MQSLRTQPAADWLWLSCSGFETSGPRCPENLSAFAACYAAPAACQVAGVSPFYGALEGLPPIHVQVGADELLLDDAVRLHDGLQSAGGSSELVIYDGVFHGWHMLDRLVPEARQALQRAGQFVQAMTGNDAP